MVFFTGKNGYTRTVDPTRPVKHLPDPTRPISAGTGRTRAVKGRTAHL